jgi:hypothetical protein
MDSDCCRVAQGAKASATKVVFTQAILAAITSSLNLKSYEIFY